MSHAQSHLLNLLIHALANTPASVLLTSHRDHHCEDYPRQGAEFGRLAERSPFTEVANPQPSFNFGPCISPDRTQCWPARVLNQNAHPDLTQPGCSRVGRRSIFHLVPSSVEESPEQELSLPSFLPFSPRFSFQCVGISGVLCGILRASHLSCLR